MVKDYVKEAQERLAELYAAEGSWAGVALALGLEERDRAAVHKAGRGSVIKSVYAAMGLPTEFVTVVPCPCGQVHGRHCTSGKNAERRARVSGRIALAGKLAYTDMSGADVTIDLERGKRLGIAAPDIEATRLHDLFINKALPYLMEAIGE